MTGGNSPTNQSSQNNQSRQASPLHAGQPLCQDGPQQLRKKSKEIIHSGHFMVSDFEAEGRDDDDELAIPVPENSEDPAVLVGGTSAVSNMNAAGDLAGSSPGSCSVVNTIWPKKPESISASGAGFSGDNSGNWVPINNVATTNFLGEEIPIQIAEDLIVPAVTIDQSLTKLFQCMTLAYSSKLTSPRWKNFKGLRLQWKDKIRLNNLIWRCWHMQFIERRNTAVCQFASPLEVDQHNKPEAVVLEGKYWKRRLATVTAEYKKWRIFFKNQMMGRASKDLNDIGMCGELDHLDWFAPRSNGSYNSGTGSLALDDDLFMDFSDTLFSSLSSNQPFPFPNPREIAKGAGLADFIQPGLIQLQPNLDDFMDTLEPLHDLLSGRLPPVEEEIVAVEDSLAGRTSSDQLAQRRNDFQLHDHSPYCASTSSSSITASGPQTLLNYLQMDQASPSYLTSPQFSHRSMTTQQHSQYQQQQQQEQLHHNETIFSHTTKVTPSSQNSGFETNVPPMGTSQQLQQQQQQQASQQLIQSVGGFNIASGSYESTTSHTGTFHRQNSGGSEHGFVVPTAQFQGKQRSRSRSGSSANTPGNGPAAILSHPTTANLSASQPSIGSSRSNRGKANAACSSSSPARLLTNSSAVQQVQEASLSRNSRGVGRLRSSSDLQPIMPVPTAAVSPPTTTVVPRAILPADSSTLLAQLLTGSNPASSATLLLTSDSSSQPSRIPIIFPLQNAVETTAPTKLEKAVTMSMPTTFNSEFVGDSRPYKQEPPSNLTMVEESAATNQNTSRSRSSDGERTQYREHRRVCHINAEQKRRCNIKNGFDTLQSLLPGGATGGSGSGNSGGSGSASGHGKASDVSKAAMLHRGAEYIRQLRQERQQQQEEMEQLKQNIEALNSAISGCQALLPANGAPVSRQRSNRMREMYDEWVRVRTLQNWKFWIFSILIQPLLESYSTALSGSTYEDLWQSVLNWVDQYCSLIALRPVVINSLRNLSKTTDIIANPSRLPAEATQAACNPDRTTTPNNLPSTT